MIDDYRGSWWTPLSRFEKLLFALLPAALALGGCGAHPDVRPEPVLTPLVVNTPVATGCVPPNLDAAPEYPDTDTALKAAPGAAERYQLVYAGRKVRSARLAELEPIVARCPKAMPK